MDKREFLKKVLETNFETVKRLIDDISEEESMRHDYQFCNHIRWQTGHLIGSAQLTLKLLGREESIPAEWSKLFGTKSKLFDNSSIYPSMKELRGKLYFLYDQMLEALKEIPPEDLEKEVQITENWKATPLEGIDLLCRHEFYHGGQITVMRRAIGRKRPFF